MPRPKRTPTPQESMNRDKRIVELYQRGVSCVQLAARFAMSRAGIYGVLKRMGAK